jgi:hypothetical protein
MTRQAKRGRPPLNTEALMSPRTVRFSQAMLREIEAIQEERSLEQPDFGKVVRELVAAGLEAKGRKRR